MWRAVNGYHAQTHRGTRTAITEAAPDEVLCKVRTRLDCSKEVNPYSVRGIDVWARLIRPVGADEDISRSDIASIVDSDIQDRSHQVWSLQNGENWSESRNLRIWCETTDRHVNVFWIGDIVDIGCNSFPWALEKIPILSIECREWVFWTN